MMGRRLLRQLGLWRSLIIYYGNPRNTRRLRRFYGELLGPGDLYFDVGAHVGNRVRAALGLGARVVALEPNPAMMAFLRRVYGGREGLTLLQEGIGERSGAGTLLVSDLTPTVSSASAEWVEEVKQDPPFSRLRWNLEIPMLLTSLDDLIRAYGVPAFCKLDVEGYELQALRGLSRALPLVSFEYLPAAVERAVACIRRLEELGKYAYNWSVAERFEWGAVSWLGAEEMIGRLTADLVRGKSGDIYATQPFRFRGVWSGGLPAAGWGMNGR